MGSTAVEARDFFQAKRRYHARLGHPPGHFFSPIPSAADIRRVHNIRECPTELGGIDIREGPQLALVAELGATSLEMPFTDSSQPGLRLSPATLDEHEADTLREHEFVNVLSPWSSFGGAVMVRLSP